MAINFPNSPIGGNTYDHAGIRYTYVDTGGGTGYWGVTTPGTVGIASAVEINTGTDLIKYVTPREFADSQYPIDIASKLASSSFTASAILTLLKTVDGAASGLDADLLDAQSSAFYRDAANMDAGLLPAARLPAPTTTARGGHKKAEVSLVSSGYWLCKETGFCIQWGQASFTSNQVKNITLPIAYTTSHLQAYGTYQGASSAYGSAIGCSEASLTEIGIGNGDGATRNINWLSIGMCAV